MFWFPICDKNCESNACACVIIHDKFIIHEIVTRTPSAIFICVYRWNPHGIQNVKFIAFRIEEIDPQGRRDSTTNQNCRIAIKKGKYRQLSVSRSCVHSTELLQYDIFRFMYWFDWTKKTLEVVMIVITGYCIIIRFTNAKRRTIHETLIFHFCSVKRKIRGNTTLTVGEKAPFHVV